MLVNFSASAWNSFCAAASFSWSSIWLFTSSNGLVAPPRTPVTLTIWKPLSMRMMSLTSPCFIEKSASSSAGTPSAPLRMKSRSPASSAPPSCEIFLTTSGNAAGFLRTSASSLSASALALATSAADALGATLARM